MAVAAYDSNSYNKISETAIVYTYNQLSSGKVCSPGTNIHTGVAPHNYLKVFTTEKNLAHHDNGTHHDNGLHHGRALMLANLTEPSVQATLVSSSTIPAFTSSKVELRLTYYDTNTVSVPL